MTRPGIEPRSPGPLANTLTPRPIGVVATKKGAFGSPLTMVINFTYLHNTPHTNSEYLVEFSLENRLECLNTEFQKRMGLLWTYTYPNNSKTLLDNIYIYIYKREMDKLSFEL